MANAAIDVSQFTSGRLSFDYPAEYVLRITLDDPDNLNTIDDVLHEDLVRLWPMIDQLPDIRAAIVTGRGRAFCAGGAPSIREEDRFVTFGRLYDSVLAFINNLVYPRTPTVAAINGPAVGVGLAMALLADISIAAEDAKLVEGHLQNGWIAGDHAVLIWPLLCGLAKTKYHVMLGEPLTGKQAAECNLVALAVPRDEVEARSIEAAMRLANLAPAAMRMTKHVLNYWLRNAMPAFELSASLELAMAGSPENIEAYTARVNKRRPQFDGKGFF